MSNPINHHSGNCNSGEGHQTIALIVRVCDADADFARGLLSVVRSGLASGEVVGDPDYACSWFGPVTLFGTDVEVVESIAERADGILNDSKEPLSVRRKAMLAGIDALVRAAID